MERADALQIQDAPHDAGMREFFAQIVIPQIRVRVPLEHGQTREYFKRRLHKGQAHQVLTAQEYGALACAEYLPRLGPDGIENGSGIIGGEINVAQVAQGGVFQILIEMRAVCFETIGRFAYRLWAETRAPPEARRLIERASQENGARRFKGALSAKKTGVGHAGHYFKISAT